MEFVMRRWIFRRPSDVQYHRKADNPCAPKFSYHQSHRFGLSGLHRRRIPYPRNTDTLFLLRLACPTFWDEGTDKPKDRSRVEGSKTARMFLVTNSGRTRGIATFSSS